MTHTVHIALLTLDLTQVAILDSSRSWQLPQIHAPRSSRLTRHVEDLLVMCGLDASLRLVSGGCYDQRRKALHHLAIALTADGVSVLPPGLRWTALTSLSSDDAAIPHQCGYLPFLRRTIQHSSSKEGANTFWWREDVRQFLVEHDLLDDTAGEKWRVHRATPSRTVCEVVQGGRRLFFYGGSPHGYDEGAIVDIVHHTAPDLVPVVLAHDSARRWWATHAVAGEPLSTRAPVGGARRVAQAIGRIQAASMPRLANLAAAGLPVLSPRDLTDALSAILPHDPQLSGMACARIEALDWQQRPSLIYLDPHPANLLQASDGTLTVIDWERCVIAPFALGHALLVHFLQRAAPRWFDAHELREGFIDGAGLSCDPAEIPLVIDRVTIQLVELAYAATLGLGHLARRELIGTKALMQRTLARRVRDCLAVTSAA